MDFFLVVAVFALDNTAVRIHARTDHGDAETPSRLTDEKLRRGRDNQIIRLLSAEIPFADSAEALVPELFYCLLRLRQEAQEAKSFSLSSFVEIFPRA